MEKQEFTHLHVHSDASFIDGLGHLSRTVSHAKSIGFDTLALTDHGNLTNAISFIQECENNNVKPIIGMEGYLAVEGDRFHITLLSDGNEGFKNLVELNNIGQKSEDKIRPTFDISNFEKYNKDIVLLSGCPESPMQKLPINDSLRIGRYLKAIFQDRFFVEMMFVDYGKPYVRAMQLADELKSEVIVTNDVHFAKKEDKLLHKRLLEMKAGGFSYNSENLYLTTQQEMIERVNGIDKLMLPILKTGMKNAYDLSQKLSVVKFNSTPKLPHIKNANNKLRELITKGFSDKVASGEIVGSLDEYEKRIDKELDVIEGSDFSSYFLILEDIVGYAHEHDIWVGHGRGSGAGSLILFLIGITKIDPIKYDLEFARFLNYKRTDYPDVDVDIESEYRDNVIDYASEKWKAKPIATYSTYGHKSSLMDLSKSYRIDKDVKEKASDEGEESHSFDYIVKNYDDFGDMYNAIKGQFRHLGKHAGGVVITNDEVPVPMIRTSNKQNVVSWTEGSSRELSKVGMVKFDLLGLTSGSILNRLKKLTKIIPPSPTTDDEVFNIFKEGNTLGVFQFGGSGIKQFLLEVQPNKFDDLVAINALYRPGPLDSGAAFEFPKLKNSGSFRSLHKDIDHFLKDTYGVIVFQEQFMRIIAWLTDGELEDADLARKVLTKSSPDNSEWVKKFNLLQKQFYEGAKNKGWSIPETDKVWGEIKTHAGYSFNKAHSVCYAYIAWELAWYKYHYPVEFYSCYLTVESGDSDKVSEAMMEVALNEIEIVNPDINNSTDEYVCKDGKIYLPLTSVKYISETSYLKIKDIRPFSSVEDYNERTTKSVIKSRGRQGLMALGAFDSIHKSDTPLHELLEVDNISGMSKQAIQNKFLGYVLPNKEFMKAYETSQKMGMSAGFISNIEVRNGKRGKFYKITMTPNEWFCDFDYKENKYNEGDAIVVKIEGKYHSLKQIYSLTI